MRKVTRKHVRIVFPRSRVADLRERQLATLRKVGGENIVPRRNPTVAELQEENDQLWDKLESIYDELGGLFDDDSEDDSDSDGDDS